MTKVDWAAFEQYVDKTMELNHIVGAAVAVANDKELIYAKGFGVVDLESQEPVNPNTIFGCASVSKSFTAMAIAQLEGKSMLNSDDSVIKHIPEFSLVGAKDMSAIKIRHLLSHTTGVPPMKRRQDIIDLREHVRYIANADYDLLGRPGEYFSYCNDTFLLNGLLIENKSGQIYRRYMTQHILDALGMNRSTYNIEELEKMGNLSTPYVYDHSTKTHEKHEWPVLGTYEVGGGVRSCVLDLVKYGQVYLKGGLGPDGHRIAPSRALKKMWNSPMYPIDRKTHYNFALRVTSDYADSGITLVEHSGAQPGVSSNFGFVPEKNLTVAVLTNVRAVPAAAIWLAAVNTVLGLPLDTQKSVEVDCHATAEQLQRFVGLYRNDEGGRIEIFMDGSAILLKTPETKTRVKASDDRTLFYDDMGQQRVLRFYFHDRDDGTVCDKPWAVLHGSRMHRRQNQE